MKIIENQNFKTIENDFHKSKKLPIEIFILRTKMSEFTVCLVEENKCSIDSARHMLVRLKRYGEGEFFF